MEDFGEEELDIAEILRLSGVVDRQLCRYTACTASSE